MSLESSIVEWSRTRPQWQQAVLARLASGEVLGVEDYRSIAALIVAGEPVPGGELSVEHMGGTAGHSTDMRLKEIRSVNQVNALQPDQTLTFGSQGITVVYGDNGSGKSGYARLLKQAVRSRDSEEVLTNVFVPGGVGAQTAQVVAAAEGAEDLVYDWPGPPPPALNRISFFDEACGDAYITSESEVTYRPSALFVLDGLIDACDAVRTQLDVHVRAIRDRRIDLPALPTSTSAAFVATISADTTESEVDAACELPADVDSVLEALATEEARLHAADAPAEQSRLRALSAGVAELSVHLQQLDIQLGDEVITRMVRAQERARALRSAAEMSASRSFDAEPVAGVGSATWRALWAAARAFSEDEAYADHEFPHTADDANCLLCHQRLGADAQSRLQRFEVAVADQTSREAADAEVLWSQELDRIQSVEVRTTACEIALRDMEPLDGGLLAECQAALDAFTEVRSALLGPTPETASRSVPPLGALSSSLDALAAALGQQASDIDAAEMLRRLQELRQQRAELQARVQLSEVRGDVIREIGRLRGLRTLDDVRRTTDTTGITRKSTELMRSHVTELVKDRFTRESDRLNLERVTLQDVGGQKGQLHHRPAFIGAAQSASIPKVLSEGEQTALGLAGFFTEAELDTHRGALVLDDPVCSLDHIRRGLVAQRLAELAQERQIVIFTHDLSFVTDLRRVADGLGVALTERAVERTGDGRPGRCVESHPWKTKDMKARLHQLDQELARIRRDRSEWGQDTYEKEVSDWAGKLSEAWERTIRLDVVGRVVDEATAEVRPKMVRLLAEFSESDHKEFQGSYGRCSLWARRHDKSPGTNFVAPHPDELEQELVCVKAWYARVKRYAN